MPTTGNYAYPPTSALQSGDLLFPKAPGDKVWFSLADEPGSWHTSKALLANISKPLVEFQNSTELADTPDADYINSILQWLNDVFGNTLLSNLSAVPLVDVISLVNLLRDDLPFKDIDAVRKLSHAFGHVAMAFEEGGHWFVAEAGCTDYSHYRVSIAPYWDADDATRPEGQKRSWSARRQALGQYVWSARRTHLDATATSKIVSECKKWLGVPYGILEPGMMTNPDRIYCSELLQKAFSEVHLPIDDNQTWSWFLKQLNPLLPAIAAALELGMPEGAPKFPLLSPKMIYTDKNVKSVFEPKDNQGKVLKYA